LSDNILFENKPSLVLINITIFEDQLQHLAVKCISNAKSKAEYFFIWQTKIKQWWF